MIELFFIDLLLINAVPAKQRMSQGRNKVCAGGRIKRKQGAAPPLDRFGCVYFNHFVFE